MRRIIAVIVALSFAGSAFAQGKPGSSIPDKWPVPVGVPADWNSDPRHYPKEPAHVDVLVIDNGKVSNIVLREVMPYEVRGAVLKMPAGNYEMAPVGKYKVGQKYP